MLPYTHILFAYQFYQNRAYIFERYNNYQLVYYFFVHFFSAIGHWFFFYGLAQALTINFSCLAGKKQNWQVYNLKVLISNCIENSLPDDVLHSNESNSGGHHSTDSPKSSGVHLSLRLVSAKVPANGVVLFAGKQNVKFKIRC